MAGHETVIKPSDDDAAARLGLMPYVEFAERLAPLFKKVPLGQCNRVFKKIYALTAKKKVLEFDKKSLQEIEHEFREKRNNLQSTRTHVKRAVAELLAAQKKYHADLPPLDDINPIIGALETLNGDLLKHEEMLGRLINQVKNPTGKNIITRVDSSSPSAVIVELELDPMAAEIPRTWTSKPRHNYPFPPKKGKGIDYQFISDMDECLPKPGRGRRSRFARDEVIKLVFEIAFSDFREVDQIKTARLRMARERRKKYDKPRQK